MIPLAVQLAFAGQAQPVLGRPLAGPRVTLTAAFRLCLIRPLEDTAQASCAWPPVRAGLSRPGRRSGTVSPGELHDGSIGHTLTVSLPLHVQSARSGGWQPPQGPYARRRAACGPEAARLGRECLAEVRTNGRHASARTTRGPHGAQLPCAGGPARAGGAVFFRSAGRRNVTLTVEGDTAGPAATTGPGCRVTAIAQEALQPTRGKPTRPGAPAPRSVWRGSAPARFTLMNAGQPDRNRF